MAKEGARVDLVLVKARGELLKELTPAVRVVDLASDRFITSVPKLAQYIKSERPQALYSHMFDLAVFAAAGIKLSGVPVKLSSTIHSTLSVQARESEKMSPGGVKWRLNRALSTWVHRHSVDSIIAVSHGVAGDFSNFTGIQPEKIKVIYNPIDIEDILDKSKCPIDHAWLPPERTIPVALAVGNLKEAKGYDTLLTAFSRVVQKIPARLIIIGEGQERGRLEQLIRKLKLSQYVDLAGARVNPYPYMAACDVFCLSSRREGFGIVLAEALALNKPIVATDCESGPREVLQNGKVGTLVPVDDVESFAQAIIRILANKAKKA